MSTHSPTPDPAGPSGGFGTRGRFVVAFLAGILVALLVVAVIVFATRNQTPAAAPPSAPPAPSATSLSSASPSIDPDAGDYEHDHDTAEDEKPQWEPVVLGFATNFTNTAGGAAKWRARLDPYVAAAVKQQLVDVDVAKVPDGHYDSYELLTPGSYQLAVKVTYREGWALVLYVTSDGTTWSLTGYDRWEQ